MLYKNLLKELKKSIVKEIANDVWLIEGYIGDNFLHNPPSSNCYVIRDGDTVYIFDPGYYPFYKSRILEIINKYKKAGVKHVNLLVSQGHFDHTANNDVVTESGLDWNFFLPEPEIQTLHVYDDLLRDISNLEEFENVYSTMFPWHGETAVIRIADRISTDLARKIVGMAARYLMLPVQVKNLSDKAKILYLKDRVKRRYGSIEVVGWEIGRLFAIHDGAHSPGHISLYDPENKILFCGDVTVEVNPAFFYSSLDKLSIACGNFMNMAKEGHVEMVADAHRSKTFFPPLLEKYKAQLYSDLQLIDVSEGKEESEAFLKVFYDYYNMLKHEVMTVHARTGDAEVKNIVEELSGSQNPAVQFKQELLWPQMPSRMDVLVASVLKEAGVKPRQEGKRIILPLNPKDKLH
ncbi:MAG: MBL fold metallo-hydrolase [Syntrophaceae bacterium]|nr:MBL fold metallo-hydrolase [Syntrophaceae bacterium]